MADDFTVEPDPGAKVSDKADEFSAEELKRKSHAAEGQHRRTQWIEYSMVIGLILLGVAAGVIYITALVIVAWHNLAPDCVILPATSPAPASVPTCVSWRWLEPDQVHKLEAVIFSSAAAAILGAVGRKYVR